MGGFGAAGQGIGRRGSGGARIGVGRVLMARRVASGAARVRRVGSRMWRHAPWLEGDGEGATP
jgi:hypothetical protein